MCVCVGAMKGIGIGRIGRWAASRRISSDYDKCLRILQLAKVYFIFSLKIVLNENILSLVISGISLSFLKFHLLKYLLACEYCEYRIPNV